MSAMAKQASDESLALNTNKDRRRYQRVELNLTGRFLYDEGDFDLITTDISCGGATIQSTAQPPLGHLIVCYFDELGRVNARVVRHNETGFSVSFEASPRKRDKLADRLIWLLNVDAFALEDERDAPRKLDASAAMVLREDGEALPCRVIDISLTGASFESMDGSPMVGETVSAGKLQGEVVRVTPGEFAIRFMHKTASEVEET
ncbi:MAG: PilZ domain-containing protein [Pseudomonadota bacterium]